MSKQRSVGSLLLCLASGVALTPHAALAQANNFAGGPFVPPKQPVIVNTPAPQETPVVTPQAAPRVEQALTLPTLFGNTTITPADTLMRSFTIGENPGRQDAGEQRSYRFDDIHAFLVEQGWQGELADGPFLEPEEGEAIIEDSNFIDPSLTPVGYEHPIFKACSYAEGGEKPVVIRVNEPSQHMWVFTDNNQFISQAQSCSKDALLSGLKGTVLSSNKDVLTIQKGCLIADAGNAELKIASKAAAIKLGSQSTAMIDYRPGNSIAIRILACPEGGKAKVRLAINPTQTYELVPGDELRANLSNDANDESLVSQSQFALENYLNSLPKSVSGAAASRFKRMEQHLARTAKTRKIESPNAPASLHTSFPLSIVASEGTRFIAADNGQVGILSGRVLLHAGSEQIVRTQLGDLYLQENSTVSVERWKGEFRAQCCSGPKSAIMVAENFGVPMNWGTEALLVDHEPGWADAFPNDGVGRRRFEMHKLKDSKCIISDFSLMALIAKGPHFKLLHKNAPEQTKELRNQLFKTAAALHVVAGNKGQYLTQAPITATTNNTSQKTN